MLPSSLRLARLKSEWIVFIASAFLAVLAVLAGDARPARCDDAWRDPLGVFTWKLPKRWKDRQDLAKEKGLLAMFEGWFGLPSGDIPDVRVCVYPLRDQARPALALGHFHEEFGTEVEGSRRLGTDFAESARRGLGQEGVTCVRRCFGKDGTVLCAELLVLDPAYDARPDKIRGWLDTFEVIGKLPALPATEGYVATAERAYDVWTDPAADPRAAKQTQEEISASWAAARAALPEDAHGGIRPRFLLHASEDGYRNAVTAAQTSSVVFIDGDGNAHMNLARRTTGAWTGSVRRCAAALSVRGYFGGSVPFWVEQGLAAYAEAGLEADGNPSKPKGARISKARNAVRASGTRTLPEAIDFAWKLLDPDGNGTAEAWAWHAWFRDGDSRDDDRDRYRRSLAALRESGDVQASRAVWDEGDPKATAARFRAWVARWK